VSEFLADLALSIASRILCNLMRFFRVGDSLLASETPFTMRDLRPVRWFMVAPEHSLACRPAGRLVVRK
jgi:hypothetical protein